MPHYDDDEFLSSDELMKRRFIRYQEDTIGRELDKPARHGRGMFRRIYLTKVITPTDLALADNNIELAEEGIREVVQKYFTEHHPELSLTRVRVTNIYMDSGRYRAEAVLHVRRKLFGRL